MRDAGGTLQPPLPGVEPCATYGEITPDVIHPGVDFPTGGRTLAVRAAADGEITRVQIAVEGHGKAVHLQVGGGREVVYSRLTSFLAAVEDSCRALQERSGCFELDWRPPAGSLPVQQGGPLGYVGGAADRGAFLHVEVRVDGIPRDPWDEGMRWKDTDPPHIDAIEFHPLSPDARIDGAWKARVVALEQEPSGRSTPPRVRTWGTIGVVARARDGSAAIPLAPKRVQLLLDGALWFDHPLGERAAQGFWDPEDPDPLVEGPPRQPLYRAAPDDSGRLICGGRVTAGLHTLSVLALDAAGLADREEILLDVRPSPRLEEWMARPLADGAWDIALRFGPALAGSPERLRVWVDLTDDGRRFPTREPISYLSQDWFLGEISPPRPRGNFGMRVRALTPEGWEVWEPTVSVDPTRRCPVSFPEPPRPTAHPSALEIVVNPRCMPERVPRAVLEVVEEEIPCRLLEDEPPGRVGVSWRFVAGASPSTPSGVAPVFRMEVDSTRTTWRLTEVFAAGPGSELSWASTDSALTVEGVAGTFNAPQWIQASRTARAGSRIPAGEIEPSPTPEGVEVLIARSDLFRLDPAGLALAGPLRLRLRPRNRPEDAKEAARIAFYSRMDASRAWTLRGGIWNGKEFVTVIERLEEWILLEDKTEPWLYGLSPASGEQLAQDPGSLSLRVREDGSGVSAASFTVLLDQRRVPGAWNPGARTLTVWLRSPLGPGRHRWEVRARDRAGNAAHRVAEFRVLENP